MAGDEEGRIFASTEPSGPVSSWQQTDTGIGIASVSVRIDSMSCPSTALCVGTTTWPEGLIVSTNPASTNAEWHAVSLDNKEEFGPRPRSVACPSVELCVVGAVGGEILTSSSPTDAKSWHASQVAPKGEILDISCPTTQLCAATDSSGEVLTSTDPQGGASAWSATEAGGGIKGAISCPDTHFCVVAGDSVLFVSTDPTGGTSAWSPKALPGSFADVACATDTFCVASTSRSGIFVSSSPAGEAGSWEPVQLSIGFNALEGVSCASLQLCVAVDTAGNVVSTQQPDVPGSAWSSVHVSDYPLKAVDCPTVTLCVAVGKAGTVLWSSKPAGPAESWHVASIDEGRSITGIDCASVEHCMAIDGSGWVLSTPEPLAGGSAWSAHQIAGPGDLDDIACAPTELCVVLVREAPQLSFFPPEGVEGGEWQNNQIGSKISCPNPDLCVGVRFPDNEISWLKYPAWRGENWLSMTVGLLRGLDDIGCANDWVCVVTTRPDKETVGSVVVSPLPAGFVTHWVADNVYGKTIAPHNPGDAEPFHFYDIFPLLTGVSCIPERLCIVIDRDGRAMMARPALPPANVSPPALKGVPEVGEVLHCLPGEWSGEPVPALAFTWLRDGTEIADAASKAGDESPSDRYQVTSADAQQELSCQVTATNGAGQVSATSDSVSVPAVKASTEAGGQKTEEALAPGSPGPAPPAGFRILKAALGRKDVLGVTLLAPGPGRFTARAEISGISGSSAKRMRDGGSACESNGGNSIYGRGSTVATQSGRTSLQVRPRRAARALLAGGSDLCLEITVIYRSPASTAVKRDLQVIAAGAQRKH